MLIEIYKAHKKSMKYLLHKESLFSSLLVDVYKVYMDGKPSRLPEPAYAVDYVIRLCQQELAARANQEKNGGAFVPGPLTMSITNNTVATTAIDMVLPHKIPPQTVASLSTSANVPTVSISAQPTVTTTAASSSAISVATTMLATSSTTSTLNTTASTIGSVTTVPSVSSYVSGASRPRGRPPGSKNSNMSSSLSSTYTSSAAQNPFMSPRLDPNLMAAAIMGMYSNSNLMQGMPSGFSDPATVNSLLNEYNKLSNLTGMTSFLGNMPSAGAFNPISTASSSASTKSTSVDTSISAIAMAANKSTAASTIISVGSGQLTITPTLSSTAPTVKQTKDSALNPVNSAYVALLKAEAELRLKNQSKSKSSTKFEQQSTNYTKPAVSVTKVPQQKASPSASSQSGNINLPKSLPKSLTITATSAGYSSKSQASNQTPQITLQPEKPTTLSSKSGSTDKATKKKSQSAQRSQSSTSMMNPFNGFSLQDYAQQMALLNQYNEIMKGVTSGGRSLADLAKPLPIAKTASSSRSTTAQPTGKSKQSKSSTISSASLAKDSAAVKQMQHLASAVTAASRAAPVAHQQQKTKSSALPFTTIAQPKAHQSSASPKMSYSPLPPFAIPSSTSPIILSPSPNQSPNLHSSAVPPALTPPGHHISPTKTLQQKLAERQKALADASKAESSRAACKCIYGYYLYSWLLFEYPLLHFLYIYIYRFFTYFQLKSQFVKSMKSFISTDTCGIISKFYRMHL